MVFKWFINFSIVCLFSLLLISSSSFSLNSHTHTHTQRDSSLQHLRLMIVPNLELFSLCFFILMITLRRAWNRHWTLLLYICDSTSSHKYIPIVVKGVQIGQHPVTCCVFQNILCWIHPEPEKKLHIVDSIKHLIS